MKIAGTAYTPKGTTPESYTSESWTYTSIYYVTQPGSSTTTVGLIGTGYSTGIPATSNIKVHTGSGNYAVTYTVSGGTLEIRDSDTRDGESVSLTTIASSDDLVVSSAFDVYLITSSTAMVTARVEDSGVKTVATYIVGAPKLTIGHPGDPDGNPITTDVIDGSKTNPGNINTTLPTEDSPSSRAFTATVTDGATSPANVPGIVVKFHVKGSGTAGGYLVFGSSNAGTLVTSANKERLDDGVQITADTAKTLYVRTNSSGQADVDFELGTDRKQDVTISAVRKSKTVSAYAGDAISGNQLVDPDSQSSQAPGHAGEYELRVKAEDEDGKALFNHHIEFRTSDGTLDNPSDATLPTNGGRLAVRTNTQGIAFVFFDPTDDADSLRVTAHLLDTATTAEAPSLTDKVIDDVVFDISGGGTTTPPPTTQQPTNRLTISTTGEGSTRSVTVNALTTTNQSLPGLSVLLSGTALTTPQTVNTGTATTITLPSTPSTYTLIATDTGGTFDPARITVTVSAPGTLAIEAVGARSGTQQQLTVTATGGTIPSGGLLVRLTGVTNPTTVTIPSGSTSVSRIATLPSATSAQTVSASATGFSDAPSITIPAPGTTPTTPTTPTGPAGVADSIEIDGSRQRSGTLAQATALRARVLDANDRGVSGVGVTFRVLAPGQGTFAGARGSGRAIRVETNSTGYASTRFTPTRAANSGTVIVEAKAAGVSAPVTFIITIGEGTTDTGTSDPAGQAKTYKVGDKVPISLEDTLTFTGSRTISGTVYTCVGSGECVVSYGTLVKGEIRATAVPKVEAKTYKVGDKISISLEDTLTFTGSRTVSGTTYTCVGSGECVISYGTLVKGEIRVAAPTSGTDRTPSRTINPEVLMGAAQRPPLLWVDSGTIYALAGADVQEFATGIENVQNIAISGNKLYWTEMTGANAGTINSANLDGTGAKQLVSIKAVPRGIAVDSAGKRLYWTNSHGWIQSSNLQGTARRNVARDLSDPMGIAVGKGYVYYTPGDGRIEWHQIGATGEQPSLGLSIGTDTPGSLAIFGNKLYWPEMTGANAGTINSANLDGTGVMELVSIKAVPQGIVVDPVAKRLYWTNSHGWIQSSNLQGTARRNVAKGLGSPGGIVLSANIKAPATPTTPTKTPTPAKPNYDVDGSGTVDNADVVLVALAVGTNEATYDVNGDGTVDDKDISLVRDNRANGAASAPMVVGIKLTAEQVGRLQAQIDLLIASGDRSPDALKTLVYLQQLIATARPDQTQLLANYPNPFNPETWIPYELATDTDVRITIYNAQGVVIRTLQLGQQSAGYYTDRERAAYWDGRNALGEQVASGIYFYQLETDTMSALRKMVILK